MKSQCQAVTLRESRARPITEREYGDGGRAQDVMAVKRREGREEDASVVVTRVKRGEEPLKMRVKVYISGNCTAQTDSDCADIEKQLTPLE